jgi:acyl-CoA synthetase (AMP-forming)/AMP-acid ligase II
MQRNIASDTRHIGVWSAMMHGVSVAIQSPTARAALAWLDHPAVDRGIGFATTEGWEHWSWAQLADAARRVATGLAEAGAQPGSAVALVEHTSPLFVAGLYGAMLAGTTPVPLAPPQLFQPAGHYVVQLGRQLTAVRPAHVVHGPELGDAVAPAAASVGARALAIEALAASPPASPLAVRPADLALIQLSSGTTGAARAVCVPHAALDANIATIRAWLALKPQDTTASWLPLHHDMGLVGCLLVPAAVGAGLLVLQTRQFVRDPLRYLRCFHDDGAQLGAIPAFALDHVVRRVAPAALAGLDLGGCRAIVVGAERIAPAALERCETLLAGAGLRAGTLLPAYGLAEATLAVTGLALGARWRSVHAGAPGARVVGCGRPLAGVSIDIARGSSARRVDERIGEIVVAADSVADGYRGARPDAPAFASERILRTGDAGFLDDGELFVLGRLGDGMKVRGRYVFAEDLEVALSECGIPLRRVAALLGHDTGGPTAVAVIENAGDNSLRQATDVLRRHAEHARIVVVDAPSGTIRRTTSGKARRRELWSAFVEQRLAGDIRIHEPACAGDRL